MRELLERDFNNLKQDIRMLEKIDFDKIRVEIAEIEKKVSAFAYAVRVCMVGFNNVVHFALCCVWWCDGSSFYYKSKRKMRR